VPHHWWIVRLIAATLTQIAAITTSAYLRRGLAHRSLRLRPVTDSIGLTAGLVHAVLYVFVPAPLINGLGHWRGAQNFGNTAYNSRLLAWVTGGESLHNNHHAHPRAPKFSMRRFEFDPSWAVIRCLAAGGLAEIVG
jgi:fatty-acid desaturase